MKDKMHIWDIGRLIRSRDDGETFSIFGVTLKVVRNPFPEWQRKAYKEEIKYILDFAEKKRMSRKKDGSVT